MLEREFSVSSHRSRNDNSMSTGVRKGSTGGNSLSVVSRIPNGANHKRSQTNGSNLFRRRHIDVIVRNILLALRRPKPTEIHLIYHLISQLNAILQLQRRYLTVSESTFLDEIVTVPTLLKIIDAITKDDFVGWHVASNSDHALLCRELQLRTIVCGLRLLRLHGLKTLDGELLDSLTQKLPFAADPHRLKASEPGEHDLYNWNIGRLFAEACKAKADFLLVYIRNFLCSLPESRTASAALVNKIISSASGIADEDGEALPFRILSKSRELLNPLGVSTTSATSWHNIYIDIDDLSWSLIEWHKRAKLSVHDPPEVQERDLQLIQEIEELVVEQLDIVMSKQLSLLDDSENSELDKEVVFELKIHSQSGDDAQHLAYSSLDLLQQLVVGALGDNTLQKARDISMSVVKTANKSSLRCKAFDILSILMQKGILSSMQLDLELKNLDVDSSLYLMILEQRDRSNSVMLTKRRLDEQSEVQTDLSIFKLPDKDIESPATEVDSETTSQVATLSFRSRPDVSVPLLADLDDWRTFLSEIELELECEGRRDRKPSDDLGMMSCGCVMSERFVRTEMSGSVCPRCHRVTEWKQPADKLRRIAKLVATKRSEMGPVLNSNHRFSVVISSPGDLNEFDDGVSSEIEGSTIPSEAEGDGLIFGGTSGGGFPKEVIWENPSIKYTPETLQQLFGDIRPRPVNQTRAGSGHDSDGSRSTSRNPSITDTTSEELNLPTPSTTRSFQNQARGTGDPRIAVRAFNNQNSTYPLSPMIPIPPTSQLVRRGTSHSDRSGTILMNGQSIHYPDPSGSVSPTRYMEGSSTMQRHKLGHRPSPLDTTGSAMFPPGTAPYGSYPQRATGALSTSPIQGRADFTYSPSVRSRAPSFPNDITGPSTSKSTTGTFRLVSPSTVQMDDDAGPPTADYRVPKVLRVGNDAQGFSIQNWIDKNQSVPQETTVIRPPLNRDEERRQSSFLKNFPFYKAEYVHHIPTGGRLRFGDNVATAIAPSCAKFALLEKKKFKVYSILASDKMPELLCCGKSTGEYGSYQDQYARISSEDRVTGKNIKWEYLMAACSDRFLAIAGTHGTLKVHDLHQDGQTVHTYVSETYDIKCIAMSADGATIALGVVNMEQGKNQTMIVIHHIDTSPDSSARAMDPTKIIVPYSDATGTLAFSEDGTYLTCSTMREPRFLVYDLAAQPPRLVMKSSRKLDISHDAEGITSVKLFPGNRLMCVTNVAAGATPIIVDNCIGLQDSTGRSEPVKLVTRLNAVGDKVHGCCISPTGQALCALDRSGNVLIVFFPHGLVNDEGRRPRCVKVAKVQGASKMNEAASICFSPDGQRLIIVDRKGDITIVDFAETDESKMSKSSAWE